MRRGVVAWRRWLAQKAGGGPQYANGGAVGDPFRDSLGKLRRRELLDRYSQHTQHCAACSQVPPKCALIFTMPCTAAALCHAMLFNHGLYLSFGSMPLVQRHPAATEALQE